MLAVLHDADWNDDDDNEGDEDDDHDGDAGDDGDDVDDDCTMDNLNTVVIMTIFKPCCPSRSSSTISSSTSSHSSSPLSCLLPALEHVSAGAGG